MFLANGFRRPGTFSTSSANGLTQRYSIRMPMKPLGTVRDKDNRHLSRVEVVMVHELMEGKVMKARSWFIVKVSAIEEIMSTK